ncbi:MAG TPA: M23 family metallopeptidase [Gemmatimonadaceae bacterium]|nr:M23 family metallopeptidase [Gemmatimonadaceae bacterium]
MRPHDHRRRRWRRVAAALSLVALAVAALSFDFRHPATPAPLAAHAQPDSSAARWIERADTLARGETLSALLARGGVTGIDAARALAAAPGLDQRRVRAGTPVVLRTRASDSIPSEIVLHLAVDRRLLVRRDSSGWTGEEVRIPWTHDTVAVSGVIQTNLYDAIDAGAERTLPPEARAELAWSLADIYEYRVDMSRELQQGDAFRLLFVRSMGAGGAVRVGPILVARFTLSGSTVDAIRFAADSTRPEYFDQTGKSLRAAFLRAPLAFRRISSVFGRRKHPVLGTWRQHKGTDYAASSGTPVRSVGAGTVIYAGRRGGYGNVVEVRHRNGFVTRYGHLRGFASSSRRGRAVGIGQTIGFVGMTGLATGPHLHFEVLVNGVHRDPRIALRNKGGLPVPQGKRAQFDSVRGTMLAALDAAEQSRELAAR